MDSRVEIERPIAEELRRFNEEFATSLYSTTNKLEKAIQKIISYSGKHIRPLLVLLTAKACGEISSNTINAAVMVELLHTSSLIHDDVIDETKQRRGVPSLNAIYDNRISVLVGDFILASAMLRSLQLGDLRIMGIIANIGRDLSEGEIKQMETVEEAVLDEECYMDVIRKKTATLLSGCAEIGALSVQASDEVVKKCRLFGEYMGYSFQIKDDIFDYYEDTHLGKPTGNDIREGKVTLPLLYALKKEEEEGGSYYKNMILQKEFTQENIDVLISFAKEKGGIEYAEQKMQLYRSKAIEILNTLPDSEARRSLLLLADYIIFRKK